MAPSSLDRSHRSGGGSGLDGIEVDRPADLLSAAPRPRPWWAADPSRRPQPDPLLDAAALFDVPLLLEQVADGMLATAGGRRAIVLLCDPLHDELHVKVDRCAAGEQPLPHGARLPVARWPEARTVIECGAPRVIGAVDERGDRWGGGGRVQALVPLVDRGSQCLGLVAVVRADRRGFTMRDLDRLGAYGRQAGKLLEGARAIERSRRQSAMQQALSRISQVAISTSDQGAMLREILRAALSVLPPGPATIEIWNRDTDEMEPLAREGTADGHAVERLLGRYALQGHQSLRFVLEQQEPVQIQPDQTGLTGVERDLLRAEGLESLLLVPLTIGGDTLGLLAVGSCHGRAYDADAVAFAEEVAAQTALAIEHARHAQRTKRLAAEQAALLQVSNAVITGSDLYETLSRIAKLAIEFEGVEGCRILLWQAPSDEVELAAEENVGDWPTFYQPGDRYPVADWPSMLAVMASGVPRAFLVTDPEVTARERANHVADGVRSVAAVPIMAGDQCYGCLALHSRQLRRLGAEVVRVGHELAVHAAHAVDRARLLGQLRARAETDGLTGLLNHRAAFETLDRELAAARTGDRGLGVIVLDLDDFKLFNDTHGHLIGDKVLVEVAKVLRECVRPVDCVARYGGDEFLIVLPDATPATASTIAGRLVGRMSNTTVRVGGLDLPLSFSVGVSTFPQNGRTRQELIAYADSSMYSAKESGGGQVGAVERGTRSLEVSTIGALSGLVRAVDRKDRYTKEHSDLVAEYAVRFGRALRLSPESLEALDLAGRLHDVGKIAVPDSILRKPGSLSPEEEAMIRQHVVFSELMIKGVPHLEEVLAAVANHHERWDGSGYPAGTAGQEIPLLGRILALADALAAMTADRPYRKGRSLGEAVAEIRAGAGRQFDPALVEPFIKAVTTETGLLRDRSRRPEPEPVVPQAGTGLFRRRLRQTTNRFGGGIVVPRDQDTPVETPIP